MPGRNYDSTGMVKHVSDMYKFSKTSLNGIIIYTRKYNNTEYIAIATVRPDSEDHAHNFCAN